jgi:hypothetical protein
MSVKLNCPPKPEESQKNSNFNGKTIPYPRFKPGTSGLAVGSHNHAPLGWFTYYIPRKNLENFYQRNFFAFLPSLPSIDLSAINK